MESKFPAFPRFQNPGALQKTPDVYFGPIIEIASHLIATLDDLSIYNAG